MISNKRLLPAASHENTVVGSKSNPIRVFLGWVLVLSPLELFIQPVCARVFHIVVERGICIFFIFFFGSVCVDLPAFPTSMFAYICTSRVLPQMRHTKANTRLKRDRCVSSWKHIQMSTKQGPGLEAEHCLLLVRQGAICHNQATKGNYLHETRAVSGKKGGGGSIF